MDTNTALPGRYSGWKKVGLPPSRRDHTSRLPARIATGSVRPTVEPKTSRERLRKKRSGSGMASSRRENTSWTTAAKNGTASINVVRPSTNIPFTVTDPSPALPQQPPMYADCLEHSLGAETPPPSLVSGSSISSHDSPRSNVLRRKPSVIAKFVSERHDPPKDWIFSQPLIQRIDTAQYQVDQLQQSDSTKPVPSQVTGEREGAQPYTAQEPIEVTYGANGQVLSRRTPVSETATSPSITYPASPSQLSYRTTTSSLTSASPLVSSSPFLGMRPFDINMKPTPRRPSESFDHPFFRQTEQSTALSTSNLPRPSISSKSTHLVRSLNNTRDVVKDEEVSIAARESNSRTPVHPPELAHLNNVSKTQPLLKVPARPSRNGTPNLADQCKTQPVVQSNLPKLNTSQQRHKTSTNSPASAASGVRTNMFSPASRSVSQSEQSSRPENSPVVLSQSQLSLQSLDGGVPSSEDERALTASDVLSKHKSRFGLFSRKTKRDGVKLEDAVKSSRKGPAAGTGHEGYGKHSLRTRSGSSSSAASAAAARSALSQRKGSNASSKASDLDDFLQQRLSPVYLRGEGRDVGNEGRNSASASEDVPTFTPTISSPETSATSTSSVELHKSVLTSPSQARQVSSGTLLSTERPTSQGRLVTDSTVKPSSGQIPRPSSRKRLVKPQPPPPNPTPKAQGVGSSVNEVELPRPSTHSRRSETLEPPSMITAKDRRPYWSIFPKSSRTLKNQGKWNFLQRTSPSASLENQHDEPGSRDSLSAPAAAPAHYLPANAPADVNPDDLHDLMQEARDQADEVSDEGTDFEDLDDDLILQHDSLQKMTRSAANEKIGLKEFLMDSQIDSRQLHVPAHSNKPAEIDVSSPSRSAPVRRIPSVVSKRGHIHKPPNLSFSRPFVRGSFEAGVHSPPASATLSTFPTNIQHTHQSSTATNEPAPTTEAEKMSWAKAGLPSLTLNTKMHDMVPPRPFLDYSPRRNSSLSQSGSSGTMHFPTAAVIAYPPGRLSHASAADENWPEYDDFIDHVLTPSPSASRSRRFSERDEFPRPPQADRKSPNRGRATPEPPIEPVGAIAAALRASPSLRTLRSTRSNSLSESLRAPNRDSLAKALKHKRSNSLPLDNVVGNNNKQADADASRGMPDRAISENPFMFRYRALMTSKWLSFGRLLFSPAHNELGSPDDRVLVIDGLGNRDWSYYCAVSYPQVQIHSLGASASTPHGGRASIGNFGNLPNYRHFAYTTPGTDFPFPKGFFAAVVYRFPIADSDAVLRSMVSECKRVLRPGGYLEVSTIDLDLSNMGTLSRRAVRSLKMQMRDRSPHILLKPISDHLQSLVGRRGFENLNRCIVGVPAAGVIGSSRENSHDGEDVDFGRLASDNSKEGDNHITKMVAQVGRWWYTRCYEARLLPNGDSYPSMWSDRELLKECEELNTTFKLLICYAQKPSCAKRRTVSL